jgi:hypothetical protein
MKYTTTTGDKNDFGFDRRRAGSVIKFLAIGAAVLIGIILLLNVVRVTRINAGYVGVEINLAGSQRGAQDIPVRTGWVF